MGKGISKFFKKKKQKSIAKMIENLIHTLFKVVPFYAEVMTRLQFVESDKICLAGTNGLTIYYNSKNLKKLSEGECNYILLHELFHVILLHCLRCDNRNPKIWNIASDCIANHFVDELAKDLKYSSTACKRPSMGCFLDNAEQYSVEELYDLLMSKEEMLSMFMLQFGAGQEDLDICMSKEEQAYIEQVIGQILDEATKWGNNGRKDVGRVLNVLANTKRLPWRQLLRKMWRQNEDEDCSYITPERKYLHMELIVSGWGMYESEKLPDIWAFIDSSSSIKDEIISDFLAQLVIISKELGATLNIAYWHTEVNDVYSNIEDSKDIAKCIPRHSGGTDVSCIYEYLKSNKIKPGVMLIFTDGYFDGVPDDMVGELKKKTIVVLDGKGIGAHNNLGKEARLN